MILTVTEHEKIFFGDKRDISKKQLSRADIEAIRIIDINNKGIFKWGNRFIIPQQWVGVVCLPGLSLEILPKVAGSYSYAELKEILLYMFSVGHNIPNKRNIKAKVDFSQNGLIEILISNYVERIEFYIREGLISSYRKITKNISTVKGSIVFSKHINKNILNPTRFVCKYSRLEINNDINKFFKYTMQQMRKVSKDYNNIKRLNTALVYFEDVNNIDVRQVNNIKIQINAINSRISEIVEYSNLFLEGYSVTLSVGKNSVSSMLFDMNKIFEMFIYRSFKKIYGANVMYQDGKHYLITEKNKPTKRIKLKPDILIKSATGANMVVDTKWKDLKNFAKESDVYQMNAYISAIPGVDTAVLMYPKTTNSSNKIGDFNFVNESNSKELKIRTVDLELVRNDVEFRKHLEDLIN